MKIEITNMSEFNAKLNQAMDQIQDNVVNAMAAGTTETGAEVLDEAKATCAVVTGEMRDSGTQEQTVKKKAEAETTVGFKAVYSAYVHENFAGTSKKPKFLEKAVMSVGPRLTQNVVKNYKPPK